MLEKFISFVGFVFLWHFCSVVRNWLSTTQWSQERLSTTRKAFCVAFLDVGETKKYCGAFWKSLVSYFWAKMNLKTSQHCCFIQMDPLQLIFHSTFIPKTGIQKVEIRKSKFWILNWGLLFSIFFQDSTLLQFSCFLMSLSIFSSFPETGWVIMRSAWIAVALQPTKCLDLCGTV